MKRFFDIFFSLIALIILLPVFILISIIIILSDGYPVFYLQERVGQFQKNFKLIKFRTMTKNADKKGFLTIGKDNRITPTGRFLRKFKIDELPQLFNILKGEMSIVGPRPETPNYVELYNEEQKKVFDVRPGLTDYASISYINENEILNQYNNPQEAYIKIIMPHKLNLNLKYIKERNLLVDIRIIFKTIKSIFLPQRIKK